MRRGRFLRYSHSSLQRLGTLKVLAGLLDPQRRSTSSDKLDHRLYALLLSDPNAGGKDLTPRPPLRRPAQPKPGPATRKRKFPNNVAEALLWDVDAPSLLFTVPEPKVFRIRDWGRQMGFLGNGNQITERGLLLQYLMGKEQVEAIRRGRLSQQNPFRLSVPEKAYLLYALLDKDAIWPFLLRRLTAVGEGSVISGLEADELTCRALLDLLDANFVGVSGGEMLRLKELRSLAAQMAESLGIDSKPGQQVPPSQRRPRPTSRITRTEQRARIRTNTADDQAIPRFENLVDLGFLLKETDAERGFGGREDSRKRRLEWRYVVASPLIRWMKVAGDAWEHGEGFLWNRFAACFAAAFCGGEVVELVPDHEPRPALEFMLEAYEPIHRPFGHTPFESVALTAMVLGLKRGIVCEMAWIHQLVLQIKRENLFPDHLKFASGNELNRMFIDVRPGFLDAARRHYGA